MTTETSRPLLARLFAEQLTRLGLATDGQPYEGALPDLELDPAQITEDLARELQGLHVVIPALGTAHGELASVRPAGEGTAQVTLDDETIEVPHTARIHVSSRAWRDAGGGAITPLSGEDVSGPLHGDERAPSPGHVMGADDDAAAAAPDAHLKQDAAHRSDTRTVHLNESVVRPERGEGPAGASGRF